MKYGEMIKHHYNATSEIFMSLSQQSNEGSSVSKTSQKYIIRSGG